MYPNYNKINNKVNNANFSLANHNLYIQNQNNILLGNKNLGQNGNQVSNQYQLQISNPEHISYNQGQKTIINNFNNVDKELSNSNNFIISSSNINLNENKNYQENSFNNIINKNKENQNFILNKNESEKQNLNENKKKEIINKEEMTNEEIEKAKENGYILIGKTGVGKTSLLNILYGKKVGKVGYSTKSETNESNYYCIKEKLNSDYIYFCLVDTPGLYDTNSRERDKIQKEQIIKLISETKIKIKGLFFLSNFQNERFDFSEQNSLLEYNSIFPLKEFWKRIIFIFTHYYGDPDGDSEEEIKKRAEYTLSKIFQEIMNKVQGVSDTLSFTLINKKYINIYSKEKNKKQCENNLKVRNELIAEIIKYNTLTPMFSKLQIFNFEKYQLTLDDNKLYDFDFYLYLDADDNPVHEDYKIHKIYEKNEGLLQQQKINLNIEDCEINGEGNLVKKSKKEDLLKEFFNNYKGEGLTALSILGSIFTGIFCFPVMPVCLIPLAGGCYLIKQKTEKEHKRKKQINNYVLDKNIIEMIKKKLYKKK